MLDCRSMHSGHASRSLGPTKVCTMSPHAALLDKMCHVPTPAVAARRDVMRAYVLF
jgi:hypothetical protein